jgi:membrane fusion protein, multidrug efflux system
MTETPSLSVPPPRSRGRWLWALLLIAVAVGAAAWYYTHQAPKPASQATSQAASQTGASRAGATPPQPVGAATVDTGDIRVILNELGTVTPLATVTVTSQISGQLMGVGFQEGQMVTKGDFLEQIDDRPYQVQLEKDQGQLAHDQGLLDQAQGDLKRYLTLGRQDSIAQQQVEDQRFLVQQYQGTVKVDQGSIDNDKLNIAYCHITAPVTGRVGLRLVDPGNYVQAFSTTGLVMLTELDPISVIFTVTEDNLPAVMQQLHAGATLSVDAYDRANTKQLATGKVAAVDAQINTTTGTVNIRALFPNPNDALFPNQFVNARLLVDTLHNVIRVPVAAVQQGAPGAFVYVINANNTVSVKTVKLGVTDGKLEQVVSGLAAGDRVVTDGTDRLRDGAKVTIPAKPTAQATGAANPAGAQPAAGTASTAQTGAAAGTAAGQAPETPAAATPATPTPGAPRHQRKQAQQDQPGQQGQQSQQGQPGQQGQQTQ